MSIFSSHRLLAGTEAKNGFKQNISLSKPAWDGLVDVRDLIRQTLRDGFIALNQATGNEKANLLDWKYRGHLNSNFRPSPRFRMQGSFSYRTVNHPAWLASQEIDLDDGVYLPTSFTSLTTPVIAAGAFFKAVEEMLEPLCHQRGWTLNKEKSSCVRIVIHQNAHIDLPLYTIPDEDFFDPSILEKAHTMSAMDSAATSEISRETFAELPKDRIMLALRSGRWQQSDPRKMENWFQSTVNEHGQHVRRISRYLKAWRDLNWKNPGDGMSSICLMSCVVTAFDEVGTTLSETRDDLTLQHVTSRLPDILARRIPNPVVEGEFLDDNWSQTQRSSYVTKATELMLLVHQAVIANSEELVISKLQLALGQRVPDDTSLVVVATTEQDILSRKPRAVPPPIVHRSTSG